jgi:hypothetical protein
MSTSMRLTPLYSNTDWGWKLTATAITVTPERVQADVHVEFSSQAHVGYRVHSYLAGQKVTAGIFTTDLGDCYRKPSLAMALGTLQLILDAIGSSIQAREQFFYLEGMELLLAMSNCVEIVAESSSYIAKLFIDVCVNASLKFAVDTKEEWERLTVVEPSTSNLAVNARLAWKQYVDTINTVATNTRLFAAAALDAKRLAAGGGGSAASSAGKDVSTAPSVLLQTIAQAAVTVVSVPVPEDGPHRADDILEPVHLSRIADSAATAATEIVSADIRDAVLWGPLFPGVGFPLNSANCRTGLQSTSPAPFSPMASDGENGLDPLYSWTHYVQIACIGDGGCSVGIDLFTVKSNGQLRGDQETRQKPTLSWLITTTKSGIVEYGVDTRQVPVPLISNGDILSFGISIFSRVDTFCSTLAIGKNGVDLLNFNASFDESTDQLDLNISGDDKSFRPHESFSSLGAYAAIGIFSVLSAGSDIRFLSDAQVPAAVRRTNNYMPMEPDWYSVADMDALDSTVVLSASHQDSDDTPVVVEGISSFCGTILTQWDTNLSDNELTFSADRTIALRPGSVSCFPASLIAIPNHSLSLPSVSPGADTFRSLSNLTDTVSHAVHPNSFVLSVILLSAPRAPNSMSFGIAHRRSLKSAGSDGFGLTKHSWGVFETRSRGSSANGNWNIFCIF